MNIQVQKTTAPRPKVSVDQLGFGYVFSDHMFIADAVKGAWQNPRIVPYGPFSLEPSSTVLHYAQEIFEGLKAYRAKDGRILLFRAEENFKRMAMGAQRLSMPAFPIEDGVQALRELVALDRDWVPEKPASLYIRPFMFGDDPYVGVRAAEHVVFSIITSPSGAYYAKGLAPIRIFVEDEYVRAVRGGFGYTKAGANYAASLYPAEVAGAKGYDQVLWLDGIERKYIEEVGSMNIFFLFEDELVTPALQGSILSGITRMSVLQMAADMGMKTSERPIAAEEIFQRGRDGSLLEVFGSGTAAVISPVGELCWKGETLTINGGEIGPVSQKLYDQLTGIQYGDIPDPYGWMTEV